MIISEMQDKLARDCDGYKPLLNGEPHALKGARVVRRGEVGK